MDYTTSEFWLRDAVKMEPRSLWNWVYEEENPVHIAVRPEFAVPSGRIDLLLAANHKFVIAEFKRNTADESAVAQVLRYAGHFTGLEYACCVLAPSFTEGARLAAKSSKVNLIYAIPKVSLHLVILDDDGLVTGAQANLLQLATIEGSEQA